jgi:hypothetical protein
MRKHEGLQIGAFYDFKRGLYVNFATIKGKKPIFIDCSMVSGMCFDNHKTFLVFDNEQMVNPNKGSVGEYKQKYNGSTLAFLLSLYGEDISRYSKRKLKYLLSIDSMYKGVYNAKGAFADINYRWWRKLGMHDYLRPITDECTEDDFQQMIDDEALNVNFAVNDEGHIYVTNAKDWKFELPDCQFDLVRQVKQGRAENVSEHYMRQLTKKLNIVSLSQVYKDTYQYSYTY